MATMTLSEFCRRAGDVTDRSAPGEVAARIADHLPGLLENGALLAPAHRVAPARSYGRNIVFVCPGGRFSVLAMVWPPGVATPIHDHKTWCAFGVYEGEVHETRFDPAGEARAVARSEAVQGSGAVGHLPVSGDIHRIHNRAAAVAVSIHVYGGDSRLMGPNLERIYKLR